METIYLVTGASGHLGSTLVSKLKEEKNRIRALVLPGEEKYVDNDVEICIGNLTDPESLEKFFDLSADQEAILFHCAGIVTVSSKQSPIVYKVNVEGTENILKQALKHKIKKMVYVSSVHAMDRKPEGIISEPEAFYPDRIDDQYGRSKAMASNLCLEYAKKGLDVSMVLPSAIYGPGDLRRNNPSVRSVYMMYRFKVPVSVEGGFDFVDVRDVAQGMIDCARKGRKGECYIVSGHHLESIELMNGINEICSRKLIRHSVPYGMVKIAIPALEKMLGLFTDKPIITRNSLSILNTNGHFSHDKATAEFGYSPRETKETLKDMIEEFERNKQG